MNHPKQRMTSLNFIRLCEEFDPRKRQGSSVDEASNDLTMRPLSGTTDNIITFQSQDSERFNRVY
jgi:hypothetical protein